MIFLLPNTVMLINKNIDLDKIKLIKYSYSIKIL